MTTTTRLLPEETIEQFRRDGFVVVDGLLTEEELERYEQAVTAGVQMRAGADTRSVAERSRYQQMFIQCMNLWEDCPDVAPLTFHQKLGQAAAELLEVPRLRLWHDQALYKLPGGRPTDAHQDHAYWPMTETPSITAWIAFQGSKVGAGAMAYLPGSHHIGLRKFINIFDEPEDIFSIPEVAAIEPVWVEVPRGSVAFHHGLTVHMADANTTDKPRAVHTIIYFKDGNTRSGPSIHFAVERAKIPIGAPIDSDVTPIVWPRPANEPIPPVPDSEIMLRGTYSNPGSIPKKGSAS